MTRAWSFRPVRWLLAAFVVLLAAAGVGWRVLERSPRAAWTSRQGRLAAISAVAPSEPGGPGHRALRAVSSSGLEVELALRLPAAPASAETRPALVLLLDGGSRAPGTLVAFDAPSARDQALEPAVLVAVGSPLAALGPAGAATDLRAAWRRRACVLDGAPSVSLGLDAVLRELATAGLAQPVGRVILIACDEAIPLGLHALAHDGRIERLILVRGQGSGPGLATGSLDAGGEPGEGRLGRLAREFARELAWGFGLDAARFPPRVPVTALASSPAAAARLEALGAGPAVLHPGADEGALRRSALDAALAP